jgi:predicted permease
MDVGFDRAPVLVARVDAQRLQLEPGQRPDLFERLRAAAAGVPGVASAAVSSVTPISGSSWQFGVDAVDGVPLPTDNQARSVFVNLISPDWFDTYGTRLLAGRDFAPTDTGSSARVVIVNEAFARKFMGGGNPIGRRITQGGPPGEKAPELEVVGYVQDAIYRSFREGVPPTMYLPLPQYSRAPSSMSVSVRAAAGAPSRLIRTVGQALVGVNGDIAITIRPLDDQVRAALVQDRIIAILSGFFGALALLLAALGLYGVTSYAVSRQRTEIGIRMALGAAPGGVVRMVLLRVAVLVGLGVIAGGGISVWATQFVSTLLYGLQPRDPATLAGAIAVLALIGVLAGLVPARRASRIDPARVLREG